MAAKKKSKRMTALEPTNVKFELTEADRKNAIACLQKKSGKLVLTMPLLNLLKIPITRRIISADCAWLID
jgi:hypothetical protein